MEQEQELYHGEVEEEDEINALRMLLIPPS